MSDISNFTPIWGVWEIESTLGEGGFGKVYKAYREEFGRRYECAIKHISLPQRETEIKDLLEEQMTDDKSVASGYYRQVVEDITNEIGIMHSLRGNTNIVAYEDHLIIPKPSGIGYDIFIRMELLTTLPELARKRELSSKDIIKLGIDICTALELCAAKGLIHRDIKHQNILVNQDGHFKLSDFGISRQLEKTSGGLSKKGTYSYMAPEVYKGQEYGPNVDIYSLGLLMYRLANGQRLPFLPLPPNEIIYSDNEKAIKRRMDGEKIPAPAFVGAELSDIILKMCAYDRNKRYKTANEVKVALAQLGTSYDEKTASLFDFWEKPKPHDVPDWPDTSEPNSKDNGGNTSALTSEMVNEIANSIELTEPEEQLLLLTPGVMDESNAAGLLALTTHRIIWKKQITNGYDGGYPIYMKEISAVAPGTYHQTLPGIRIDMNNKNVCKFAFLDGDISARDSVIDAIKDEMTKLSTSGIGDVTPITPEIPIVPISPDEKVLYQHKKGTDETHAIGTFTLTTKRIVWKRDPTGILFTQNYADFPVFISAISTAVCSTLIGFPSIKTIMKDGSVFEFSFAMGEATRDWVLGCIHELMSQVVQPSQAEQQEPAMSAEDLAEELRMHNDYICKYCGGMRSLITRQCKACGKGNAFVCNKCGGPLSKIHGRCKKCPNDYTVCMFCSASKVAGVNDYTGICQTCGRPRAY